MSRKIPSLRTISRWNLAIAPGSLHRSFAARCPPSSAKRLEWNLEGEQALTISFVLIVEKHKAASNGGLLAIDSLDVEIAP